MHPTPRAVLLLGFLLAHTAWAQTPAVQLGRPIARTEASPSRVFPDGGFPVIASAPEGNIPIAKTESNAAYPALQPVNSDYGSNGSPEPSVFAEYRPSSAPLPEYYYRPGYYDQAGIGARPLADYAPPGLEEREFQDAPGAPEYTPITAPARVTPEEREKFVTRGLFPGSYLVPGSNTSFRFRGFVRLTGLYDFNPILSRDDFVTATIPVPQQRGENFNYSARYSRIGLDTWTPTAFHEWNVHTFIEADFFNGPAQAVGGGGNPFRLRFAFVDFGYFRLGQQNTIFMDSSAFPSTVDFAGPRGLVNQRRPGARMTVPLCDKLFWACGVEKPFSDITTNGLGVPVQDVPDFASHLRYEADYGHLQLSMLQRTIGYRPFVGPETSRSGWGFSASSNFHPWAILCGDNPVRKDNPSGLDRSRILLQYTFGWGITRYLQDTAAQGLDAQVDPVTGAFDTLYASGWSVSYEHWFCENWLSNVTYSGTHVGHFGTQPGNAYQSARYLATSLWWIPVRNMSIGVEYVYGQRENLDGERGRAQRVNALFQYNF